MQYEIRDGRLHLTGYVNAVERDSKEIMTKRGRCVEQIRSGAFAKSLERNPEVRMKLNHKRTVSADMTLREDTIGLHVEADTDDEEIMALAAKGELRGWSFGFEALDDEIEQRDGRTPRRIVKDLDLSEVSVLSVTPAYNGTSLEYRSEDMCGDDSAEDVPAEDTAAETEETQADDMPVDDVSEDESPATLTDEQRAEIEQAKAYVEHLRRVGELERIRTEQRELEKRYNHYHNPSNGQFASGKDGGMGLYYSMGKGKGEVVGASSALDSDEAYKNSLKVLEAKEKELSDILYKAALAPYGSPEQKNAEKLIAQADEIGKRTRALKEKLGLIKPPVMSAEETAVFVKHYREVSDNFEKKNKPYK